MICSGKLSTMRKIFYTIACASLFLTQIAVAGPDDPSRFQAFKYGAQKAVYHLNHATPIETMKALRLVQGHVTILKREDSWEGSKIAVVIQGNSVHAFSRLNQDAFPDIYDQLKILTEQGVEINVCAVAARSRGYEMDQFYDLVTLVTAGTLEVVHYQKMGYGYFPTGGFPKMSRTDLFKKYPELDF
jgi:uncharacterized protein